MRAIEVFPTCLLTILSLCGLSTSCPSVCTCNGNQTDCSELNQLIFLDSILDQLPSDTTSLTLSKNNFTTVEPGRFSNLSDLLHLDLSRNHLSTLHPSSFSQLNSLEFLDLSENRLAILPVNLFSDLRRLKHLDLSLNSLTSLPTNLLDGLQNLVWLSVVGNKLTNLQRDSLEQATALQHLLLEGNVWNCSCELIPLQRRMEWILYKGGHVDSINCAYPTNLRGKDLRNIPTEMFGHCHSLHFKTKNPPATDSQAGSSVDCIRQRYRPVSVRRAAATVVVAGVVCGVVCVLMVVTATYGCIYAMMAAHKQQQLKQGDSHKQPLMSAKEPEQDLMNEQKEDLMPNIRSGAEAPECAGWMAFPPEVCV